ncbi:unnamed protein product [Parnassius mnemosyne]|uniref:DDE Tnp4 domain-containing protein n=2 Tax=Parnassius mnemosyne TaxID=213953 RepID=A0AAV1LWP2_9NEOP
MNENQFDFLLSLIENDIEKQMTQFRKPISAKERLVVTLRFLATGESFRSLGFRYRIGFSTIKAIVLDVTIAIWKNLKDIFMPKPTKEKWKQIAKTYSDKWQFPNCVGSLDGKHVMLFCPNNAGTSFYNYKGRHSVVLLALVDANYKFIAVDVGAFGRNSDGGVFAESKLGTSLATNTADIPADTPLENGGEPMPHVIIGDQAFPLKPYLMRPYSKEAVSHNANKKNFNYRLSRARRTVENAFGILSARWRIFHTDIKVQPEIVDNIILCCCCLHNMLRNDEDDNIFLQDLPNGVPDNFIAFEGIRNNSTRAAFVIRDKFCDYFSSENGSLPWENQ